MNQQQYFLTKLAEEASELAQIALKTAQFGVDERYPEDGQTNGERLASEVADLLAVLGVLGTLGVRSLDDQEATNNRIQLKLQKMEHYLKYSIELGKTEKNDEGLQDRDEATGDVHSGGESG
jgi:NTP pyrophosphatase (non-canonical NTP hydrolase)